MRRLDKARSVGDAWTSPIGSVFLEIAAIDVLGPSGGAEALPLTSRTPGPPRRRRMRTLCALAVAGVLSYPGAALAQATGNAAGDLIPVGSVPPPPPVRSGEVLEPEVTIVQDHRGTVQEYRVGGRLVGVKITPRNAPAYYLVDADGDGHLETRRYEHGSDILVNAWLLFSWK